MLIMRWALACAAVSALMCGFPYRPPTDGGFDPVFERGLQLLHYALSFLAVAMALYAVVEVVRHRRIAGQVASVKAAPFPSWPWVIVQFGLVLVLVNCHRVLVVFGVPFISYNHGSL